MHSGMTGQVGSFQNPGVCLEAFPYLSSLPPPSAFTRTIFPATLSLQKELHCLCTLPLILCHYLCIGQIEASTSPRATPPPGI